MQSRDTDSQRDPRELEREVENQRSEIEDTLTALMDRFVPERIIEQIVGYARRGGGDVSRSFMDAVRANPLPTLLTATGLTWMLFGQSRRSLGARPGEDSPSRASYGVDPDYDSHAGEGHRALGESAPPESAGHRAEPYRHRGGQGIDRLLREQPLAVGVMGIALGALIGASLPRSRQEDELLGDYGDRMRRQVSRAAQEASVRLEDIGRHVSEPPRTRH